jgi:hypothetical protein
MSRPARSALSTRFLAVTLTAGTFGACQCDEVLYAAPGDLVGVICSVDSGQALAGIPITIVDAEGDEIEATTDGTGLFRAERVASGTATLKVHSPDGEREIEVVIESGHEARYDDEACHPPPVPPTPVGSISGCVCDEPVGAWVSAANVYVITNAGSVHSALSDDVGCFDLIDVPVGPQLVHIQKGAFYEEHNVEVLADGDVVMAMDTVCEPPEPPEGAGSVEGRVCAPDGTTWLSEATVYVEDAAGARIAQDTTDTNGAYTLTGVPAGPQIVHIEKGSFSSTVDVVVPEGGVYTVPEAECSLEAPDVQVAVVTGDWDRVQDVLANIGVDAANVDLYEGSGAWASELLENYELLSTYDIVFLNCGLSDSGFRVSNEAFVNVAARDNLKQFVTEGGSVYASDWAYAIVERAWSDSVDFVGDDNGLGSSKQGATSTAIPGTIVDAQLAAAMGDADIELHYPLPSWVPMEAVAQGVTVYISGAAPLNDGTTRPDVPHTVGFNAGAGRVIYTSFHQEPGISLEQERVLELLMFEL